MQVCQDQSQHPQAQPHTVIAQDNYRADPLIDQSSQLLITAVSIGFPGVLT